MDREVEHVDSNDLDRVLESLQDERSREVLRNLHGSLQSAEQKATEAEENLHAAVEMQKEEYSRVMKEIFAEPMKELIKRISRYSLVGIIVTLVAASLSFLLATTLQRQSDASLVRIIHRYLSTETHAIRGNIDDLHDRLSDIDFGDAVQDEGVKKIVAHFREYKDRFEDYGTKSDLARAYKIKPVVSDDTRSGFFYFQYRIAFRQLGLKDIPTIREIQEWDAQAYRLYNKWYEFSKNRGSDTIPPDDKARKWDSFKSDADDTHYRWEFTDDSATFDRIGRVVLRRRDAFLVQWRRNKGLLP